MNRITMLVVCALALAICAGAAWAQEAPPADTLKVDYFANANTAGAPDATVRIDNPGTSGGNLCAAIYVFDVNEELSECCSCLETPDGLRTLSVNSNLTSNPLTGVILTGGVIKVVSTKANGTVCPSPTSLTPTAALRAWATHIQNSNFTITETASQDATFSSAEESALTRQCAAIHEDGSGSGICTCGTGD
jgi:hypothetical protein